MKLLIFILPLTLFVIGCIINNIKRDSSTIRALAQSIIFSAGLIWALIADRL